ncbi:MAG: transporter [Mariprofundus sp.]|nr:transporter [Mariprofundus sp.]
MRIYLIAFSLFILLPLQSVQCHAAEAGAHAYNNLPIDLNIVQVLYFQSESSGGLSRLTTQAGVLRYYRTFPLFGQVALIGGFLPYARAKLDVPSFALHKQVTGISDPTLVIGMDFFGAPALTREQFKHYKAGTVFGGSLQITAPLGRYDPASRLNLSGNRWVFKPELALTQTIADWEFELLGHYHHFTSNKTFLSKLTREQRGRWGIDAHLSYTIMRGMWLSLDYLRRWSGETSINGVRQGDQVRDSTIGITAEMAFSPAIALQLTYRNDIVTQSLNKTRSFTLKTQYLW